MKTKMQGIEKLLKRREDLLGELETLAGIEGQTRTEAEARLDQLNGRVTIAVLALPLPEGQALDAETARATQELHQFRQKLELLPGVRARVEAGLKQLGEDLANANAELQLAARREAVLQVDALRRKLSEDLRPVCGADLRRSRAAVDCVVENSEARRWETVFARWRPSGEPAGDARRLMTLVALFLAGKPYVSPGNTASVAAAA